MRFIILLLLLFSVFFTLPSCSTGPKSEDTKRSDFFNLYGGSGYDVGTSIAQTIDGGVAITGFTSSDDGDFSGLNLGLEDSFVIKLNSSGKTQWIKTFGGSKWNIGKSIAATDDGGLVLTGITGSTDGIFNEIKYEGLNSFVIKLNDSGNIEWVRAFSGNQSDEAHDIIQTADGGFLMVGTTRSSEGDFIRMDRNNWDIFVVKLDPSGVTEWTKLFGGSGVDEGTSVTESKSGEFFVTGFSTSNDGDFEGLNSGFQDIFVMKLNSLGEKLWVKTFGGSGGDRATSISLTSDNGLVLTGRTWSDDGDFSERNDGGIFVAKISLEGNLEWIQTLGGSLNEEGLSIAESSNRYLYLTGWTESNDGDFYNMNEGAEDIFVAKLNLHGEIVWIKTFGGSGFEQGNSIIGIANDEVLLTGWTDSKDGDFYEFSIEYSNIFVLKLNSDGNISN